MSKIILITGGQRSGKSRYAEEMALGLSDHPVYMATAKVSDNEKVRESIDHLINPLDNAINEKCSRIKKVFLGMMDEYTASYYFISSHTQKHIAGSSRIWYERLKVITLPRELVSYSASMSVSVK